MSIRTFRDEDGRRWSVWTVEPVLVDRRFTGAPESDPPVIERRKRHEVRIKIGEEWANGWLAFQTDNERRRLATFPADWAQYPERELAELCTRAHPVTLLTGPKASGRLA